MIRDLLDSIQSYHIVPRLFNPLLTSLPVNRYFRSMFSYHTQKYKINPKGTSIKKLKKAKKAVKIKLKKQSAKMAKTRITGYQVWLATNKF